MFYVSGQRGGTHNAKTTEDEKELVARILNRYPSFNYAKVNTDDANYDSLVKAWGIIKSELSEAPSVLMMQAGTGVWIHGNKYLFFCFINFIITVNYFIYIIKN